jgi:hypothetical protein
MLHSLGEMAPRRASGFNLQRHSVAVGAGQRARQIAAAFASGSRRPWGRRIKSRKIEKIGLRRPERNGEVKVKEGGAAVGRRRFVCSDARTWAAQGIAAEGAGAKTAPDRRQGGKQGGKHWRRQTSHPLNRVACRMSGSQDLSCCCCCC